MDELAALDALGFSLPSAAYLIGAVVYVPVVVGAGYAVGYGLGHHIERLRRLLGDAERLVLIALALAAVAAWVRRGRRRS